MYLYHTLIGKIVKLTLEGAQKLWLVVELGLFFVSSISFANKVLKCIVWSVDL